MLYRAKSGLDPATTGCGCHRTTVSRWLSQYRESGLAALQEERTALQGTTTSNYG
ncbi:helix-turn-helix domain-containing protein [Parathermosynechococcus lividus]